MTRTRRSALTLAVGVANTVAGVLVGLVVPPLLLRWLGDDRLGAYRVAMEYLGYIALLDFGLSGGLQAAFAAALGRGERAGVVAVAAAGARAFARLALLVSACVLGMAFAVPSLVTGLSADLQTELMWGFLAYLIVVPALPLSAFRTLADAAQKGYYTQGAMIGQTIVGSLATLGLAYLGAGLPGQFVAAALAGTFATAILAYIGLRTYPEVWAAMRAPGTVNVAVFSGAMFAFNLSGRVSLLSDSIIVGAILGPAAVVRFTFTQKLAYLAQAQVLAVGNSTWAALADLHHSGERDRFNARLVQLTRGVSLLGVSLLVPVAVWNQPFVSVWVGEARYGGAWLTWLTVAYLWLHGLFALWCWTIVGTGRVAKVLPLMLVAMVVNVAISIAGTAALGEVGPAAGSVANFLFVANLWMPFLLRREFGTPVRALAKATLVPLLPAIPFTVAWLLLAEAVPIADADLPRPVRFAFLGATVASAAATMFLVGAWLVLPAEERREWLTRLRLRRRP